MPETIHPINAFPDKIQEIISHYSETKGYPAEYFLTAMLGAFSVALGRAVTLNTGNFTAVGIIWYAIVGKPGITKSPSQDDAFKPIKSKQFEILNQYDRDLSELEVIKQNNPKDKTEIAQPERFFLSDVTPEALTITLSKNPRGSIIVYDELAGFVSRFNRYNAGGDEQMYLSLFNGDTIIRTRVDGKGNAAIRDSFLSIGGTIQPSVLKAVMEGKSSNGFFDRWIITNPDNIKKQYPSAIQINPNTERDYFDMLIKVHDLKLDFASVMQYSESSHKIIFDYQCALIDIQNETESDENRSILAKMEIYLHRFALLLQVMYYSLPEAYNDPSKLTVVSDEAAKGACILCDYYTEQAKKIRVLNPVESLKDQWVEIYKALPPHGTNFNRLSFVKICDKFDIKDRRADVFLKENSDRSENKLFFKVKHGEYTKNLF